MLENVRSSKVAIVFVVCLSVFTDTFMYGLVIPVLPYALVARAHVDPTQLQFWNTTFMASWAGAILLGSITFGVVTNLGVSKKWAFISGQVILAASTALFMFAKNLPLLIVARILQGISGGAIATLGYTLTFDSVGKDQIGMAVGYVTMSESMGIFFGPIVGGPLYDAAGYIWVFIPPILLIGIEILMRMLLIEPIRQTDRPTGERQRLLDESDETNYTGRRPSSNNFTRTLKKSGTKSSKSPLLVLLGNRRFVVAMTALFVGNNFVGAIEATLPVFAYHQLRFSSTQIGLLILTATWPQFLGPLAGWVVDKAGPKWPTAAGLIIGGISLVLMRLVENESSARLVILIVLLTLYGCSITLFWGPVITEISLAVDDLEKKRPGIFGKYGGLSLACGLQNAAFGAGAMLGPIYAGAILVNASWSTMTLVLGIVSLITAVPVIFFTGGNIFEKDEDGAENSDPIDRGTAEA